MSWSTVAGPSTGVGMVLGLALGCGLLLVWGSCWPRQRPSRRRRPWLADDLVLAGLGSFGVRALVALSSVVGLVGAGLVWAASSVPALAVCAGLAAGTAPTVWVRARARRRRAVVRTVWPDAVDDLVSAARAGLALPEGLAQLGTRGPEQLRPAFLAFAADYRATGRFGEALDALKDRLADPVADRIVEALRLAREVGGTELGTLLRTVAQFLREDVRTRSELEARQGWTVNAARLAVAAPWVVLLLLSTRSTSVAAYATATGALVLALGAVVTAVAYRVMLRLARLPDEPRVLR